MKIPINSLKIAHRGLWNKIVPENSIESFKRCIDTNTPIELDIHILKDNTLVVFHDDDLKRMTKLDSKLKDMTYEDIKDLKLNGTDEHIPKFEEVLDLVKGKVLIDIEIKTDVKSFKICKEVSKLLDKYDGPFFVKSFNPFYITWFRFNRKEYQRGILVSKLKGVKLPWLIKYMTYNMWFNFLCKPDFIAFNKNDLPNKKIEKLHKKGMPILLWTVRGNFEEIKYDGIIYEKK
jgi:glycerophosphoryl diester phosphodiesterase